MDKVFINPITQTISSTKERIQFLKKEKQRINKELNELLIISREYNGNNSLENILKIIGDRVGIIPELILSKTRVGELRSSKLITVFILRKILNYTYFHIGKIFNLIHGSIVYAYNQALIEYNTNIDFKNKYDLIVNDIENKIFKQK